MKVLHVGKFYPPCYGGIEKVNVDLVEGLNYAGIHTDELCFSHTKNSIKEDENTNYKIFRAKILGIKFSTPISLQFFSFYKKIRNDYDIIHIHLPNPIASLAPLLFKTKGKIVLHWHSDIVKQKRLKVLYSPLQNMILRMASKIIVTSDNYLNSSVDLIKFKAKTVVIPLGIDTDYLCYSESHVDAIKAKYKNKKIVLTIGRLTYYKGFKYLIAAAKKIDSDTVVLIGGSGELENVLKKQIIELNLTDKVFLIGRIPQCEMGAYYAAADVFCLPSMMRTEAFGVVLIEALAMGLPIVATNIDGSGVNWVNKHNVTGLNVVPENDEELADAINTILSDTDLSSEFSANALLRYKEYFTKSKMLNEHIKLYQFILTMTNSIGVPLKSNIIF
ncbi:MAG: glycosyltransferase [Odoribacter sp.]